MRSTRCEGAEGPRIFAMMAWTAAWQSISWPKTRYRGAAGWEAARWRSSCSLAMVVMVAFRRR